MTNTRRTRLGSIGGGLLGTAGCLGTLITDGGGPLITDGGGPRMTDGGFTITSPAFDDGARIPDRHTCSGADSSPQLNFDGVPDQTAALALVVDDPDAPGKTFTHWLLWNVSPDQPTIPADVEMTPTPAELGGAKQGQNDFGSVGYRGPCPPEGDGPHTYQFRGFAIESSLDLDAGAERDAVLDALEQRSLASDVLAGTFERE